MVQFVMLVAKVFIQMLLVILANLVEMLDLDVLTVLMLQLAQDATQQPILLLLLFKEDVSVLVLFIWMIKPVNLVAITSLNVILALKMVLSVILAFQDFSLMQPELIVFPVIRIIQVVCYVQLMELLVQIVTILTTSYQPLCKVYANVLPLVIWMSMYVINVIQ